MPTYEYRCKKCGHHFDVFKSIKNNNAEICPVCGGETERVIRNGSGIIFKGTGFYITDYKKKHRSS